MPKPAWSLVLVIVAQVYATSASSAEKLRMSVPTAPDTATRTFVDVFRGSPYISAADIEIETFPEGSIFPAPQAVSALQTKLIDLALVPLPAMPARRAAT